MTPDTTPAPMTLEDTLDYLRAMSLDMPTLNKLKRSPSSRTIEEWHEVIQGALHHLETAKRDSERLDELVEAASWSLAQANAYGPMEDSEWGRDHDKACEVICSYLSAPVGTAIPAAMSTEKEGDS